MTFCRLFPGRWGSDGLIPGIIPLSGVALLLSGSLANSSLGASSSEQFDFFEQKIRPLFTEHCYQCHSQKAEKIKGGLRLDTREALLKGGDSGPIIIPGNPDASLLIKAVRYTDPDLQMPPKDKKLSDEEIANLEAWVKMGAPDPRNASGPRPLTDVAEARSRHWAFQPLIKPTPPTPKNLRWVQNPIDGFILVALEKNKLQPAPVADRRALIRRASYDLTGLPPTWEEVEAFVRDKRPDAYPRLVDRLLDSPHYGERWARYWLDIARFADTKGYLPGGEERRYPFSFTYRDYVVQAYNQDKPYDRFVTEQLAADLLLKESQNGSDGNRDSLAALGFLTLGRRFLNNQNDIIDDRIDLVSRGLLGLTVACARCHDHKFDPIPTSDYYSLHGIFASSEEPTEKPLLAVLKKDAPEYQDYLQQKEKIETEIVQFKDKEVAKFLDELRQNVGDYLLGAHDAATLPDPSKFDTFAGERKLNPAVLRRWMHDLDERSKKPDPIFDPWFRLVQLSKADGPRDAKKVGANANPIIVGALPENGTNSLKQAADVYSKVFKEIDAEWKSAVETETKEKKPVPSGLTDPNREALRQVLYAEGGAINMPRAEAESINARRLGEGAAPFRNRIEALNWTHPGAPRRAMALVDRGHPANSHVFLRGNPSNLGEEISRHFLQILSDQIYRSTSTARPIKGAHSTEQVPSESVKGDAPCVPPAFTNGSGRLELARAIVSPKNPLTARVYVNRLWLHHFGEGLVSTPGDFGVRTEAPVHRALLDFLATSFIESGWSTKAVQRLILLSATYQQSSDTRAASLKIDPDNRLFSRMNRQRLDFEATRDTLLDVAGKLDPSVGGLPVDITSEPFSTRRTLYALIDRQNLPALFRTFDFANPDTSSQRRFHTTVPQQALFLMNNPFVIEQARNLAQRSEIKNCKNGIERIRGLYRLVYQRTPTPAEEQLAQQFLAAQSQSSVSLSPVEKFAQILLLSNELMFVD